jgi:hypothetical protein
MHDAVTSDIPSSELALVHALGLWRACHRPLVMPKGTLLI